MKENRASSEERMFKASTVVAQSFALTCQLPQEGLRMALHITTVGREAACDAPTVPGSLAPQQAQITHTGFMRTPRKVYLPNL